MNVGIALWSAAFEAFPRVSWTDQWQVSLSNQGSLRAKVVQFHTQTLTRRFAYYDEFIPGLDGLPRFTFMPWYSSNYDSLPIDTIPRPPGAVPAFVEWVLTAPDTLRTELPTPTIGISPISRRPVRGLPLDDFRGWPMRSLYCTAFIQEGVSPQVLHGDLLEPRASSPTPSRGADFVSDFRALPLGILWPGFIVNSTSFTTALWFTVFLTRHVRRSLRWQRGRCPACAYDLRGQTSPGCPECGAGRTEPRASASDVHGAKDDPASGHPC